ncbi:MAG: capsule assembly Wzi family protein, partial [Acidobacteria bacterium]|nr:capsule assembly Wzi family protein [Acidobacteriota bacterium]
PAVDYGSFENAKIAIPAERMSSTYIQLDSWIYPAIERLTALGVVNSSYLGLRPWTRMSVYQMISSAQEPEGLAEATQLLEALRSEFDRESELRNGLPNESVSVDRIYTRSQYISGLPLNDGFHFGQAVVNDFGRPFGGGLQQIAGFESRAESGRFSFFVRGEYQHSPSVPGYSQQVNQTLATIDNIPGESFNGEPSRNSFRLLDTYASFNLLSNEISVGKQSYWWGATDSSALMLSNNAAPFYGLRINRTLPLYVPFFSRIFGTVRYDNYFGRLYGNNFPPDPFTFGQKFSMHPTQNLELGFSRSSIFAGKGLEPLTLGIFKTTFTSTSSGTDVGFNPRFTPGTRHANFDFRYRLPFVRDWATVYADSFVHDDVSPVDAPNRAALLFGLYLARVPKFPRLDVHVEGGETDSFASQAKGGNFYYYEGLYKDSYTINRNLLGSWIGREGTGGQAWATYWLNPKSSIVAGFRDVKVSQFFIPQGETQQDAYGILTYQWQNGIGIHFLLQRERWVAPLLASGPQGDTTAQIQLSFWPKDWKVEKK